MRFFFTIFCSFLIQGVNSQDFLLKRINAFDKTEVQRNAPGKEKQKLIHAINSGDFIVGFENTKNGSDSSPLISLMGESGFITFEIVNPSRKPLEKLKVSINTPDSWNAQLFKQELLNDWYSNQNNKNLLNFFNDPLFPLLSTGNQYIVSVKPGRIIRLTCQFFTNDPGRRDIVVRVNSQSSEQSVTIPVTVLAKNLPDRNVFSSVAFNYNNKAIGADFANELLRTGFTHLQVNAIPTVKFYPNGKPVSNTIDQGTTNSELFRNTAINWLKTGGKILLFWGPRYESLALTENDRYIQPYTREWYTAYNALIKILKNYLKSTVPGFSDDQLVIYLADEVSSSFKPDQGGGKEKLAELKRRIVSENPAMKFFGTFGYYSELQDLDYFTAVFDIAAMHFQMPEKIQRNKVYSPARVKGRFENRQYKKLEKWAYNVERGIQSEIEHFRFFPLIAAANDYEGFSWWALFSHNGSTWINKKENGLNYSLYYEREPKNPVYRQLSLNTDTTRLVIPSLRLAAISAGLTDARLIRAIKSRRLSDANKKEFNEIVTIIRQYAPNNSDLPDLNQIENISARLHMLYAKTH